MEVYFSQKTIRDITILNITGRMADNSAYEFEKQIDNIIKINTKIIIDLSGVEFISSSCLSVLLATFRKVRMSVGNLIFCGLNKRIKSIFNLAGLSDILNNSNSWTDTVDTAIEHFKKD